MKLKAGNLEKLKNLKYESYKTLAKSTFKEMAAKGNIEPFFITTGEKLEFKTGTKKEQHLLYIGDIKAWKQVLAKEKWKKDSYSYGFCRINETAKGVEVELKVTKGTLAMKPAEFKVVVKAFATKFKPKTFISVVQELEGATEAMNTAEEPLTVTLDETDLIAAFNMFKDTELAIFKAEKTADNAEDLITKAREILNQIATFSMASEATAKVKGMQEALEKTITQVEAVLTKLTGNATNGEAASSGSDFSKVNTRIDKTIEDLLSNYASEISDLGLKTVLESVKNA